MISNEQRLCEKWPYSEFFCFVFSRIRTEYGDIRSISLYLIQMRENTDQKNSEYGHFLCNEILYKISLLTYLQGRFLMFKTESFFFCSACSYTQNYGFLSNGELISNSNNKTANYVLAPAFQGEIDFCKSSRGKYATEKHRIIWGAPRNPTNI